VWVLALGLLLPTMHQSSLGTMMLLPATKLHPIWFTPWLPLLFLVNSLLMGYGAVVLESHLAARFFNRARETDMLGRLAKIVFYVAVAWTSFRVLEVAVAGDLKYVASAMGMAFAVEIGLHLWVISLLASEVRRRSAAVQFKAAVVMVLAGLVFRVNTYLVAFKPGDNWSYFPAVPELLITLGIIALEIALYIAIVKRFPILSGQPRAAAAR
jgi:Ni/Fe-hydrogenase subunit HybB-like protein